jgi:hypothetical protein
MEYRWLTDNEIEQFVNPVCKQRGWAELNINEAQPTCRVLGAFDGPELAGFFCIQLFPVLGPQWVDSEHRDGTVSRELTDRMAAFFHDAKVRGCLVVCDSPVSERLAQRHQMQRVESPVYMQVGG